MRAFLIYLIGINILTFLVFGIDKWKARRGKWRIPEDTLIWMSIAGGSFGALVGMYLFRHKTQKRKFNLGIPAILLAQAILVSVPTAMKKQLFCEISPFTFWISLQKEIGPGRK